jgi:hypothetical protein
LQVEQMLGWMAAAEVVLQVLLSQLLVLEG